MRRAIATVSMSGTLRDKLEAIALAGFDAVELFEPDFVGYRGTPREARRLVDDLGLGIDLYQPLRDFEGVPRYQFERNIDRAERKFDLMQELGAPLVLVCSNTSPSSLGDPALAAEQLHTLAERAARRGLRVGYEALAWGRWVQRYGQAWAIVRQANHPHLALILDSFHTSSLGDDPAGIAGIPGDRIAFVQMADAPRMTLDVIQWARHHRKLPAQGDFDLVSFLATVLLTGYTGTLSLEIFNDVFRAVPNRRTATDAMRSLLHLESQVRDRFDRLPVASPARPAATAAIARVGLHTSPAPARLAGWSFLEFGADEDAVLRLGGHLERLGFLRYGVHRTKAVTLFAQGNVRLVLNCEPGSEARRRFDQQGVAVCCLGVAVDDPARAAARGAALLSDRRDGAHGGQEQGLPAIVAPGHTIVQFVPAGEPVDVFFEAAPRTAAGEHAGLTDIDHIAMGLSLEQFDTWVLFARAVLGLEPGESLDLADPFGLIRTCGLADEARRLRVVLNVSLSSRTRTAEQVRAAGEAGGGIHHIALACDDIVSTVDRLLGNGVRFVPISTNYYDDLDARVPFDAAHIGRLRDRDIVFDNSGGGEYYHAYVEPFEGRFFFEIVQRVGYDGYGAVNASARLASVTQGEGGRI
jgi:4-hydroxyphenylpyruvate dioxygenase